ncbi:MAG: type II toxin-antitoxin system MqsA family antitoxin [Deltaproteobacteria bacterium]|nr:type II toxin-antitoxin system MqsA family antitoxin [Deltaproteobacteria bacterium]
MLKHGDTCPVCGQGPVEEKVVNEPFKYKGREYVIPDYHIFACGVCKEELVSHESLKTSEKTLTDFRRKIDGLLTSDEIKAIRKRLGKTQKKLAEMLDVGEKTFARYENGQVTQSKIMDLFLRGLEVYPDLLDSIKFGKQAGNDYEYETVDAQFMPAIKRSNDEIQYQIEKDEQADSVHKDDACAAIAA